MRCPLVDHTATHCHGMCVQKRRDRELNPGAKGQHAKQVRAKTIILQGVLGIVGRLEKETDAPRVGAPSTGCTRRLDGYADEVTVRIPVQLRQSNSKESENGRVIQLQQLPDERRCGTAGTPASLCPVSAPHACRSRPARSYSLLGVVSRPSSSGATTSTALQVHPP